MTNKISKLTKLTGLTDDELADTLEANPRAYMAVKGAVAEKHLAKILDKLIRSGLIKSVREANGDFDKDFYIENQTGKLISVECKNIEVIKTTKKSERIDYLNYLIENKLIPEKKLIEITANNAQIQISSKFEFSKLSSSQLTTVFKYLPQQLRESGLTRYQFSSSNIAITSCLNIEPHKFIEQFDDNMLSIDFQRTRNSTDTDGDTRRNRLYQVGEVDIVAACLFTRTMNWEFIYAKASTFEKHKKYRDRYKNNLKIHKRHWTNNIMNLLDT